VERVAKVAEAQEEAQEVEAEVEEDVDGVPEEEALGKEQRDMGRQIQMQLE
jgi:hypothetical protein